MNSHQQNILVKRTIPEPQKIQFSDDTCVIDHRVQVVIEFPTKSSTGQELVKKRFSQYFQTEPQIESRTKDMLPQAEGYHISVSSEQIVISASEHRGMDYAMSTLRQLAEPERGAAEFKHYILPCCTIEDSPKMNFRGIHLCIFPETPMWAVEKQLRLAAYYKFNHAVIESWGVFPFKSHPEFSWADRTKDIAEFEHLKQVAKDCNITIIPQFNILGHASVSRAGSAKHAVLDLNPTLQSLFEPSGWCFCLTNPAVREFLSDLVIELHEFYECPPYFHIGCDEADGIATCSECLKHEVKNLVREHICCFHELLSRHGARTIMWHDMLLNKADERWKDCITCGGSELETLYHELPRDIIIADWQYGTGQKNNPGQEFPTAVFFKQKNFDVLMCPWQEKDGTEAIGGMIENHQLFGMLETTWHTSYGYDFFNMLGPSAMAAWCGKDSKPRLWWHDMAAHIRQIGYDMQVDSYEQAGCVMSQIPPVLFQS